MSKRTTPLVARVRKWANKMSREPSPLVDWNALRIPPGCVWNALMYGIHSSPPEARQRATALLLAHLNEQQRDDYSRMQRFAVRGASGVVYVMGLDLYPTSIEDGKVKYRYCAPPHRVHFLPFERRYELPMEDVLLTWKLHVEGDEKSFLAIAMQTSMAGY